MMRTRHAKGSVVYDKRRKVWNYLFNDNGTRRTRTIGTKRSYPTKASAWKAVDSLRQTPQTIIAGVPTLRTLAQRYEAEKLSPRAETRRVYHSFMRNHILPTWGEKPLTALQPRDVELWLRQIPRSPKTRSHLRNQLHALVDYAMWSGVLELARNPISLVRVQGATKRTNKPRSLTVAEFQKLIAQLAAPFNTMALVAVCLGLRVSECLALKWGSVDWLAGKINVTQGIVKQIVDDVKTEASRKRLNAAPELLEVLKLWKAETQFSEPTDWIFASPVKQGRLPYSYTGFWRELQRAGNAAGIGNLGTHTFRHTYRSWLDAVGTPIAVQQKLMRHADIRTTMNTYGDIVTDEMQQAGTRVAGLAMSRQTA
jgi:integrase